MAVTGAIARHPEVTFEGDAQHRRPLAAWRRWIAAA